MEIPSGTTFEEAGKMVDQAFRAKDVSMLRALRDYHKRTFENTTSLRRKIEWIEAKIDLVEGGGRIEHCDIDSMRERLISEYSYSHEEAQKGAHRLANVSDELRPAVIEWWQFNRIADLSIHDVSLALVVEGLGYTLPAALTMMDGFYRQRAMAVFGPAWLYGDPFKKERAWPGSLGSPDDTSALRVYIKDIPSGTTFEEAGKMIDQAFQARDVPKLRALRDYHKQAFESTSYLRRKIEWIEAKIDLVEQGGRLEYCDIDSMRARLISEYGYTPEEAQKGARWLNYVSDPLQDAVMDWWEFNRVADLSIHDVSLAELVERFGYTLPAALAILDALNRQGEDVAFGPVSLYGDPFKKK